MFLRAKTRFKDGKEHRYWSIVESRRIAGGRVVQRHVLYLGEINDSQKAAWCKTIKVFDESGERSKARGQRGPVTLIGSGTSVTPGEYV
jgi:hypothetical protein